MFIMTPDEAKAIVNRDTVVTHKINAGFPAGTYKVMVVALPGAFENKSSEDQKLHYGNALDNDSLILKVSLAIIESYQEGDTKEYKKPYDVGYDKFFRAADIIDEPEVKATLGKEFKVTYRITKPTDQEIARWDLNGRKKDEKPQPTKEWISVIPA